MFHGASGERNRLEGELTLLADLRRQYHQTLCAEILGRRADGTINTADSGSVASRGLAERWAELINQPLCSTPLSGQTAGNEFTRVTMEYLRGAFAQLAHLRPGDWFFAMNPSEAQIAGFDQYGHLAELREFLAAHRELATAMGSDYLVTPDIVVGRQPVEDTDINAAVALVTDTDAPARRTPLRAVNGGRSILHATVSCKWTMRSDRAQNTRTEALNLIRNRKGRSPHIAAVTCEPLPGRIASIAMGTGDVDCTYHAGLDELVQATRDLRYGDAEDTLITLIEGRRLRDISDLPLDLASALQAVPLTDGRGTVQLLAVLPGSRLEQPRPEARSENLPDASSGEGLAP